MFKLLFQFPRTIIFCLIYLCATSLLAAVSVRDSSSIESIYFGDYIPTRFENRFEIYEPHSDQVITSSKIQVKVVNRFLGDVFINGKRFQTRKDGRVVSSFELEKRGKQNVMISFVDLDYNWVTIRRKVLRLDKPKDLRDSDLKSRELMLFVNSDFVHFKKDRLIKDYITRSDLAYFIYKLKNEGQPQPVQSLFYDIPDNYWAGPAISFVIQHKFMAEYPDGSFKPHYPVSKLEYIMAIAKAFELDFVHHNTTLPYSDINPDHWTTKFILKTYQHQFLETSDRLEVDKMLDWSLFYTLVSRLPHVTEKVIRLLSFEEGYTLSKSELTELNKTLYTILINDKNQRESTEEFTLLTPEPGEFLVDDEVVFKGIMNPPQIFFINDQPVRIDIKGRYLLKLPLVDGKNKFVIDRNNTQTKMIIYKGEGYLDLVEHWAETAMAKLRFLKILSPVNEFHPNRTITRRELANVIDQVYHFSSKKPILDAIFLLDIDSKSQDYHILQASVKTGLFSLFNKGLFKPYKLVTRAEALSVLIRAQLLDEGFELSSSRKEAFKDIPKNHWALPYIQTALDWGIVSERDYFYPRKRITKVNLMTMISRTPRIRELEKEVFDHD